VVIALDTIVHRRADLITEAVLADVVVLDPESGRYARLNASSAALWEALRAADASVDSLARLLLERYGAPSESAEHDARAFVEAMADRGLVELS
jgi:hypothetical protein